MLVTTAIKWNRASWWFDVSNFFIDVSETDAENVKLCIGGLWVHILIWNKMGLFALDDGIAYEYLPLRLIRSIVHYVVPLRFTVQNINSPLHFIGLKWYEIRIHLNPYPPNEIVFILLRVLIEDHQKHAIGHKSWVIEGIELHFQLQCLIPPRV